MTSPSSPDGDLCADRDRLSAAGHKGGDFQAGGTGISRDVIAALKRHGLIDGAIRAPQPGAPFAYVTTRTFLEAFGFATLRDLPDLERLKAEGLLQTGQGEDDLDIALGLSDEEKDSLENNDVTDVPSPRSGIESTSSATIVEPRSLDRRMSPITTWPRDLSPLISGSNVPALGPTIEANEIKEKNGEAKSLAARCPSPRTGSGLSRSKKT